MSFTLDRVPARGITKAEHDAHVAKTGRPFTDPYILPHLYSHGPNGGTVPVRENGTTKIDPKAHREFIK